MATKKKTVQVDGEPKDKGVKQPRPVLYHYGRFFLLGVEVKIGGVLMVLEDPVAKTSVLVSSGSRLDGNMLRDVVTTVANVSGVANVARVHYGQCPLYEVDFNSASQVSKLLNTLHSHTFQTKLLELLSKFDSLDSVNLSLSVKLYLTQPLPAQRECSLITVTLSNYLDCLNILSDSMIFDYQATHDDRFTRPEPTLQLVVKHLQGLTQWFSLGIHLDVPYPQVKAYCRQYGDDDQRGLTEVINTWIKNGEASWPSLAVALKGIGEIDRAKQIATEYDCKGVLLISLKEPSVRMEDTEKQLLALENDNKVLVTTLEELNKNLQSIAEDASKLNSQQKNLQENLKRQIELRKLLYKRKNSGNQEDNSWVESAIEDAGSIIGFLKQQLKDVELELKEKDVAKKELEVDIVAKEQKLEESEKKADKLRKTCKRLHTRMISMSQSMKNSQQQDPEHQDMYNEEESSGEEESSSHDDDGSFVVGSGFILPTTLLRKLGDCLKCDEFSIPVDIYENYDQVFIKCPSQEAMEKLVQKEHRLHSTHDRSSICHLL